MLFNQYYLDCLSHACYLIGGETTFMLPNMAAAIGHVNGGRLRALGVTSLKRVDQIFVGQIKSGLAGWPSGWSPCTSPFHRSEMAR